MTAPSTGRPCWVDLACPEPEEAARFYSRLFGWRVQAPDSSGYRSCSIGDRTVAGLGPQRHGLPPAWLTHIRVSDVEGTACVVEDLGSQVLLAPHDTPGLGRRIVFTDNTGAVLSACRPIPGWETAEHGVPGAVIWHELRTHHPERAEDFYAVVFGWEARSRSASWAEWCAAGRAVGGMRTIAGTGPPGERPGWTVHFAVDDVTARATEVLEAGGQVAPRATPGGNVECADPAGAVFGLSSLDSAAGKATAAPARVPASAPRRWRP